MDLSCLVSLRDKARRYLPKITIIEFVYTPTFDALLGGVPARVLPYRLVREN